ncbi:MAG: TIGR04076 family protein [Pelotomaculum sp.]|jgi:uncharacterized repeat protein (TIGR04076 family)
MYKYKVIATIVEIRGDGVCTYGHKVGDSFEFGQFTPGGLCQFAADALRSAVAALLYGGNFPWATDSDTTTTWACPDPDRPVIFELRRVPVEN